jgi:hypothetical protein
MLIRLPFKISICRCKVASDTSPFLLESEITCQRTGTMYRCLHNLFGTSWEDKPRSFKLWWSVFSGSDAGFWLWGMSGSIHRLVISSPWTLEMAKETGIINLQKSEFSMLVLFPSHRDKYIVYNDMQNNTFLMLISNQFVINVWRGHIWLISIINKTGCNFWSLLIKLVG